MDFTKILDSLGGIQESTSCTNNTSQIEDAFLKLEALFNSKLPQSYKDFYRQTGAFSFNNLISVKCIDTTPNMLPGNKLNVGHFYCKTGNTTESIEEALLTCGEQLPKFLLPICDGELGDTICISLRKVDHGYIYYFDHESLPENKLILIAKSFEDFVSKLELHQMPVNTDIMLKDMKVEITSEFLALLKKDGYGPKE